MFIQNPGTLEESLFLTIIILTLVMATLTLISYILILTCYSIVSKEDLYTFRLALYFLTACTIFASSDIMNFVQLLYSSDPGCDIQGFLRQFSLCNSLIFACAISWTLYFKVNEDPCDFRKFEKKLLISVFPTSIGYALT
jgi:hypothetical protein